MRAPVATGDLEVELAFGLNLFGERDSLARDDLTSNATLRVTHECPHDQCCETAPNLLKVY